jgi:hypothetical protein
MDKFDWMPPEIQGELEPYRKCAVFTMHGQCAYFAIKGEKLCIEHSQSARARRLRQRQLALLREMMRKRWHEFGEIAMPDQSGKSLLYDQNDDGSQQLRLPFPVTSKQIEEAMDKQPSEEAREWGEIAATYFATEQLVDMDALKTRVTELRAKAAVREEFEMRREERVEKRRLKRVSERSQGGPVPIFFRGDLSTPYGLSAAADGVLRLYAGGNLTDRRCTTILKLLRLVALGRILGSGRPLKVRDLAELPSGPNHVIETDTRPYETRRAELKLLRQRLFPRAMTNAVTLSVDDASRNKTDQAGSLSARQIDEIADEALSKNLTTVPEEEASEGE